MAITWLPPRRYVIPSRSVISARGLHTACVGTQFCCSDGRLTGWGDAPDALTTRVGGRHRRAAERFAQDIACLDLEARQHGVSLAAWLHAKFPQWTVPPRDHVQLQALVDFVQLRDDPQQPELRALGLTWLKVKLAGTETPEALARTAHAARDHGWTLRLDVNGAWHGRADLAELLSVCQRAGVAYVEDAVPVEQLPLASPVALAADAIDSSVDAVMAAALAGHCQVVVVKPPLWGSVARLLADVATLRTKGAKVVLSSSFEGPIGLAHLGQLAAVLPTAEPAGLPTHLLWPAAWQPLELLVTSGCWALQQLTRLTPPEPFALMDTQAQRVAPVAWPELHRQAQALAAHLATLGVGPGQRVATWAGNSLPTLVAWHAVRLLAATWLPLHPRLTAAEVQPLLDRTHPTVLMADASRSRELQLDDCRSIDLFSIGSFQNNNIRPTTPNSTDIAALLFTSGSSGAAKGVALSWRALNAAADATVAQLECQPGGSWLCCLPICHVSGLLIVERAARMGMTVLLADQPSTQTLAELLHTMQPRLASLVPAQLTRLLDGNVRPPQELLAVLIGGAPCPPELVDRAHEAGWPILPSYGMTETAAQVATAPLASRLDRTPWPRAADAVCVGPPMPGVELRIDDGEILVRSEQLLSGYLGEPSPVVDGWLHTGDLGRLDCQGWLWVQGRRGELILRGGENITPDEVEAALRAIPGVQDVCVVGVPDRVLGQRVAAWLTVAEAIFPEVIRKHLDKLAAFKHPERWLQTAEPLPRTGPGKVARGEVRARLEALGSSEQRSDPAPG